MKATDLMIGDWMLNACGNPIQVGEILEDGINGVCEGGEWCDFYDDIKPIPLTPQILEKNGFHTNYDHTLLGSCIYRRMYGKYDEYEVVVRMLNGWVKIKSYDDRETDILTIDIQPRFVHKLQHALRICGLNELADNFKV